MNAEQAGPDSTPLPRSAGELKGK